MLKGHVEPTGNVDCELFVALDSDILVSVTQCFD